MDMAILPLIYIHSTFTRISGVYGSNINPFYEYRLSKEIHSVYVTFDKGNVIILHNIRLR